MLAILLAFLLLVVPSRQATPTKVVRNHGSPHVTTQHGQFFKNGKPFNYIGTNAYWIHNLNTDKDLDDTMKAISSYGVKVVRTWAFNDVTKIPPSGVYFQLWNNGTAIINAGENGLLRLDKVVKAAAKAGLHILFTLTNNWNPDASDSGTSGQVASFPPEYLSNDYGGMDTYVRQILGPNAKHDEFYTDPKVIAAFKKYLSVLVPRFKDDPNVLGWELANDPRCNSTIPSRNNCSPQVITKWTADVGAHVKTLDPNHLVASGDAGFYCLDCPKLFPHTPSPAPSNAPGKRRRTTGPLTKAKVLARVNWRSTRFNTKSQAPKFAKRAASGSGIMIRGMWIAPLHSRQIQHIGPSYDGSQGVDTEDLANVPSVDFSSFQYFPDQNQYSPVQTHTGVDQFTNTVQQGIDWIQQHAETSMTFGKPAALTGFGIVSLPNSNTFTPVNSTHVTPLSTQYAPDETQQASAYTAWIDEAIKQGVSGIIQYQWGQTNLTTVPGGVITTNAGSDLPSDNGISPNDGYAIYSDTLKKTLQDGAAKQRAATDGTTGSSSG